MSKTLINNALRDADERIFREEAFQAIGKN